LKRVLASEEGKGAFILLLQHGLSEWSYHFPTTLVWDAFCWASALSDHEGGFVEAFSSVLSQEQCHALLACSQDAAWHDIDQTLDLPLRGRFRECDAHDETVLSKDLMARLAFSAETKKLLLPLAVVALTKRESGSYGERKELQILVSVLIGAANMNGVAEMVRHYLNARALVYASSKSKGFHTLEFQVLMALMYEVSLHRTVDIGKDEPARIVNKYTTTLDYNFPKAFQHQTLAQHLLACFGLENLLEKGYFGLGDAIDWNDLRASIMEAQILDKVRKLATRVVERRGRKMPVNKDDLRGIKRLLEPDMEQEEEKENKK
jgi:hypothetical protein